MSGLVEFLREYREIWRNFFSLGAVQATQLLLPLVVFPFLARALGIEQLGKLAFCTAFVQYFSTLVIYGFNLDVTKEIAVSRNMPDKLSTLIRATLTARLLLLALAFLLMLPVTLLVGELRTNMWLVAIICLQVVGEALFPMWYFQGMESMQWISLMQIALRMSAALGVIAFVRNEDDLLLAGAFQAMPIFLGGWIGLLKMHHLQHLRLEFSSMHEAMERLKSSWTIFLSMLSVTLYTNTNMFLLGLFAPMESVGYFTIAEKVIRAAMSLPTVVAQAIYPRVSALFSTSIEEAKSFLRRIAWLGTLALILLGILLVLLAEFICQVIAPRSLPTSAFLIQLMAFLPLLLLWDNIYGTQVLLNFNRKREFSIAVFTSGIVSILVGLLTFSTLKEVGATLAFIASQLTLVMMMFFFTRRIGFRLFQTSLDLAKP
ncbi:MAG: oligosaccharide flippase family protein [Chloroherpetonaceae bacterium]